MGGTSNLHQYRQDGKNTKGGRLLILNINFKNDLDLHLFFFEVLVKISNDH